MMMKKLFIGALALTAFTACSQDEIVEQQSSAAITFNGTFVDNATRAAVDPSTTTASIDEISVWGFMDQAGGDVFNEELVSKSGTVWTYVNTQYWMPGHDYYFAAISPVKDENVKIAVATTTDALKLGLGTVTFKNEDGTTDLLYDAKTVSTQTMKAGDNMEPVKFTMSHLLSKVKFTFTNGFVNPNNTVKVKNIKMVAPGAGSINLAVADWWSEPSSWVLDGTTVALEFGDMDKAAKIEPYKKGESDFERLTIPAVADQSYEVTFDVELYSGEVVALQRTLSTTITGAELEMGKAYNFHATLNETNIAENELKPIEFEVIVKEWIKEDDYEGGEINTDVEQEVATAAALLQAVKDGYTHFKLTADINDLTEPFAVSGQKQYFLNLNGHHLVAPSTDAIVVSEGATLTIDDNTGVSYVKAATTEGGASANAVWVKEGKVIINGGNYYVGKDKDGVRNDCIYASSEAEKKTAHIIINGGTFASEVYENGQYWVLNINDGSNESSIKVFGGIFKQFDPANNKSEGEGTNFVADGYYSEYDDTSKCYFVKAYPTVTGAVTALTTSSTVEGSVTVANATLEGNGNTLFASDAPTKNGLVCPSGTAAVKNLTINGKGLYTKDNKNLRAIFITSAGDYSFDNVNTTGTGYALNVSVDGDVTLKFQDSVLEGWTSYGGKTTATFTNVSFTKGDYALLGDGNFANGMFRPYGMTTLKDCKFESQYTIDFGSLVENATVTFENCYVGETKITADNIATLLKIENYSIDKKNVIFK